MKTGLLFSGTALLGLCVVSAFPGCGSSSNGNNANDAGQTGDTSTNDSSSSSSGGDDGSSGDAIDESFTDGSGGCTAKVMPTGKQVLASATVTVQGVTSDGQIIYYDGSTQKLNAVPAAGGTPAAIGAWDKSQSLVFTSNKVALYWNGTGTQTTNVHGALSVWTSGGGQHAIGAQSFFSSPGGGYVDVSTDGSLVLYTDNVTTATADIYVAGSDGSNKTKLVPAASLGTNCRPVLRFAGNTPVVSYCTSQPDGGTTLNATVAAFSGAPNWQPSQTFATDAFYGFSVGHAPGGSTYTVEFVRNGGAVSPSTTAMYVEDIGGTTATLIDGKGSGGIFTNAGTDVIYFEDDATLWRSPIVNPAPVQITSNQFLGTLALSADDKWVETFQKQDPTTSFTDMYLTSTTPTPTMDGGNPAAILSQCTGTGSTLKCTGANFGDAFTADDSRAIFFPNVILSGSAGYVGAYDDLTLPPSGMPATIAQNVWEEFATSGAKTLYNDNYLSTSGFAGAADIESIDLSATGAMPTTLVSQADANFFLTSDKKTVVYSWSACPGAKAGIYTVPAP